MKITHNIITLSTAVLLVFSVSANAFAANLGFKDLDNVEAKDKIIALQEKGIILGTSTDAFSPDSAISAAETIQLFVRAFNLNLDAIDYVGQPKASDFFKNADDNAWYAQTLIFGAANGLDFPLDIDLNKGMNREEYTYRLVTAIEKYGQLPMINMMYMEYTDVDQVTVDYSGAIQRAIKYGIVALDKDGKFNPKASLTRAEAAEELYIALQYMSAHDA
ncbi:MAG: S-layer homology domain-containing protein [Ignavibacteriaceae bacterium]|nr:S-layer homology domain-containing protein [Ignavibacteriaceae bacterium]